jgi:uncharacterized protein
MKRTHNHSISTYFISIYLFTWGLILAIAYPKLIQSQPIEFEDVGLMFLGMLLGPCLIGLTMTGLYYGRLGLKDFYKRLTRVRLNYRYYLLAVMLTPTVLLLILTSLSLLVSIEFMPGFQIIGIVLGFAAGVFEEIGWTGFALPELQKKYSPIKSGIILGLLWGFWHFAADYIGASSMLGSAWLPTFVARYIIAVTAYRVIMVWVYNRTQSIFISQIMHGMFSGSLFCFGPMTSHENGVVWNVVFSIVMSLIAVIFMTVVQKSSGKKERIYA